MPFSSVSRWSAQDVGWCIVLVLGLLITAGAYTYFTFWNIAFFRMPDPSYYDAVAGNLLSAGRLADPTAFPQSSIYTPQNGIVFVEAALRFFLTHDASLTLLALIQGILLLASGWFVYRLGLYLEFARQQAALAALAFLLSPILLQNVSALLNDGIFIFLFLGGLLALTCDVPTRRTAVMTLLACVIGIFRLQGILLFAAAAIGTWRFSRNEASYYALLTVGAAAVPFMLTNKLAHGLGAVPGIAAQFFSLRDVPQNLSHMLGDVLPQLLLPGGQHMHPLYWVFVPLSLALWGIIGWESVKALASSDRSRAIITMTTLLSLLFSFILPYYAPRYYLHILPLLLLLPLRPVRRTRLPLAVLSAAIALAFAGLAGRLILVNTNFRNNLQTMASLRASLPASYFLVSELPSLSYYVLGIPARRLESLPRGSSVVLFGTSAWQDMQQAGTEAPPTDEEKSRPEIMTRFSQEVVPYQTRLRRVP
ncbi:MAG: hypothetical protein H0U98_02335 [Alphaproteobacteria bacterium]|nr:hypothetical protein [Alphaproteobacteria bacterium]